MGFTDLGIAAAFRNDLQKKKNPKWTNEQNKKIHKNPDVKSNLRLPTGRF